MKNSTRYTILTLFGFVLFAVIFMIQQQMYHSNIKNYLESETLYQRSLHNALSMKHEQIHSDLKDILKIQHSISGGDYFTIDAREENLSEKKGLLKLSPKDLELLEKKMSESKNFSHPLKIDGKWYTMTLLESSKHPEVYIVSLKKSYALEDINKNRLKQLFVLIVIVIVLVFMLNRLLLHTKKLKIEKEKIALALKESNLYFDNAMVGFVIIDKHKKILKVNNYLCETFGYTKEELLGKTTDILHLSSESFAKWCELISKKLENGLLQNIRYEMKKKNGEVIHVELSGVYFKEEKEVLDSSIVWTIKDMTEIEEQEASLQRRVHEEVRKNIEMVKVYEEEKLRDVKFSAIGKLSAGITHEINTPLTYIKGNLEMMKLDMQDIKDESLKEELISDCSNLEEGVNRIATIVESMREMSQNTQEEKEPVNIYDTLVTALVLAYNRSKHVCNIYLNDKLFSLDTDKQEFECLCVLQKQRIEQVWIVIINNALDELQHIEAFENRKLYIDCSVEKNEVVVRFRDNAGGIDEEILADIFEPFVSTKTHGGMGVGLSISKKILQEQEGKIEAYNENGGAVFEIRLPKLNV